MLAPYSFSTLLPQAAVFNQLGCLTPQSWHAHTRAPLTQQTAPDYLRALLEPSRVLSAKSYQKHALNSVIGATMWVPKWLENLHSCYQAEVGVMPVEHYERTLSKEIDAFIQRSNANPKLFEHLNIVVLPTQQFEWIKHEQNDNAQHQQLLRTGHSTIVINADHAFFDRLDKLSVSAQKALNTALVTNFAEHLALNHLQKLLPTRYEFKHDKIAPEDSAAHFSAELFSSLERLSTDTCPAYEEDLPAAGDLDRFIPTQLREFIKDATTEVAR
jgi:hypothetical protein